MGKYAEIAGVSFALICLFTAIFGVVPGIGLVAFPFVICLFFYMACFLAYELSPAKERAKLAKAEIKRRRRERTPGETPEPSKPSPITPGSILLRSLRNNDLILEYECALHDHYQKLREEHQFKTFAEKV